MINPDLSVGQNATLLYQGEPIQLPLDLFIPPDALEIWLDTFEGPFDLLLYLIKKNNLDILNIPIAEVARQYSDYLGFLEAARFELAAEYLAMAAWLAEIKSRLLLPKPPELAVDNEDYDPRAELVKRLQEYAQFKQAAMDLDALPRMERDNYLTNPLLPPLQITVIPPKVELTELVMALKQVLQQASHFTKHKIDQEVLSVRERMTQLYEKLEDIQYTRFEKLFNLHEGKRGVAVTFMACLELIKQRLIELEQEHAYAPIYVRKLLQ